MSLATPQCPLGSVLTGYHEFSILLHIRLHPSIYRTVYHESISKIDPITFQTVGKPKKQPTWRNDIRFLKKGANCRPQKVLASITDNCFYINRQHLFIRNFTKLTWLSAFDFQTIQMTMQVCTHTHGRWVRRDGEPDALSMSVHIIIRQPQPSRPARPSRCPLIRLSAGPSTPLARPPARRHNAAIHDRYRIDLIM